MMDLLDRSLRLSSSVIMRRKGEKYLFLDPEKPCWTVTNSNGAAVLKLCDGTRTVRDISHILSRKMGNDKADEVMHFLEELIAGADLFSPPGHYVSQCQDLRVVHLNLTQQCNLHCLYCYASERKDSEESLGLADWCRTIDAINDISKTVTIELTGGEPLLTPWVFDVARYAKEKGNPVHLLTNGLLIDEAVADRIAPLFDLIRISM